MLMEMPFVKTVAWLHSDGPNQKRPEFCKPFQCESEPGEGGSGVIGSQWKKVRAQAVIKLFAPEGLLTWLFFNSFMEQLHLTKITNIVKWVTPGGLQGLA